MRALGIALAGIGALAVPLVGAVRSGASVTEAVRETVTRAEAVAQSAVSAASKMARSEPATGSRSAAARQSGTRAVDRALVAVAPLEQAAQAGRTAVAPAPPEPPEFVLVATSKETIVYARPSAKAPKLGYLRSGAIVSRDAEPTSFDGCRGGFYGIAPEGFVCVGPNASIDPEHDVARAARRRADRTAPLPYVYGVAPVGGAPINSPNPTDAQPMSAEQGVYAARGDEKSFDGVPADTTPWFLTGAAPSIAPNGVRFSATALLVGSPTPRSGFAFTSLFVSEGRRFGLTVDMTLVPLDRVTKVEPSRFHGIPLVGAELPVVFTRSKSAALYSGDPQRAGLKLERRLEFREAVPITGRRTRVADVPYLETKDGMWIVDRDLVRVNARQELPAWANSGRTWIDVSISKQTLVAYEGTKPVFVTLVSTGIDGAGDPETTHSTIQGQFLIHTKHVTTTMDGDEAGDEFDLREVPYVQYFKDGFALHAAYWHDGFGVPRSHGCVNLSPLDARWLFAWTEPHVPAAWHGAMSARGTLVSVRE